ncbi:MAG: ABC transporter ATP-binding protein [Rhodothermales bacterium]
MAHPAVRVDALTHRYGAFQALDGVSFSIESGHLFGLLGPNGSGKTTLFRSISTLIHPTSGRIEVFGHSPVTAPAEVRPLLGVIFQDPALDGELTILENLTFHGSLYGLAGAPLQQRIQELLVLFGLKDRERERISKLSGGQKRRVDLIRGLLHRPRLLLLDEPTTGLDPIARRTFWDVLHQLRRREGVTMIVATHLLDEAEACDALVLLSRGRLIAQGSPAEMKARLGDDMLWLSAEDPESLAQRIHAEFGYETDVVGNDVRVAGAEAIAQMPAIYERMGGAITSATVRKPTLEDVFMVLSGRRMEEEEASA